MRWTEQDLEALKAKSAVRVHSCTDEGPTVALKEIEGADPVRKVLRTVRKRRVATFEHQLLCRQLTQAKIAYKEEFRFNPKRRWCFDFLVDNFGVEIVGGLWMPRGGHSQGKAQLDDMEKFNHAALLGYRVLQFSPDQVKSGEAIGFIERVLSPTL